MSKLGAKLVAAAEEAVAIAKGEAEPASVHCPYCAAEWPAWKLRRQWIHRIDGKNVICHAKGLRPS